MKAAKKQNQNKKELLEYGNPVQQDLLDMIDDYSDTYLCFSINAEQIKWDMIEMDGKVDIAYRFGFISKIEKECLINEIRDVILMYAPELLTQDMIEQGI